MSFFTYENVDILYGPSKRFGQVLLDRQRPLTELEDNGWGLMSVADWMQHVLSTQEGFPNEELQKLPLRLTCLTRDGLRVHPDGRIRMAYDSATLQEAMRTEHAGLQTLYRIEEERFEEGEGHTFAPGVYNEFAATTQTNNLDVHTNLIWSKASRENVDLLESFVEIARAWSQHREGPPLSVYRAPRTVDCQEKRPYEVPMIVAPEEKALCLGWGIPLMYRYHSVCIAEGFDPGCD